MYFPLLVFFFSATTLATSADTTDLTTPVVKTVTSYSTVTASALVVTVTSTDSSDEEAMSIYDSELDAFAPTYPIWVESVLETAIPTTWKEMMQDASFHDTVADAEASGVMPAWFSSLPSDVKYVLTSDAAVYYSEIATISVPSFIFATSTPTPGSSSTTAPGSSITSSSTPFSTTLSTTTSGFTATTLKSSGTSTSTGGAPVATGGFAKGIAGAAGIFGLALAL